MRHLLPILLLFFAVASCSVVQPEDEEAELIVGVENHSSYEGVLAVDLDIKGPLLSTRPGIPDATKRHFYLGIFRTGTSGELDITARVEGTGITQNLKLELKKNWMYVVTVAAGPDGPAYGCFGCQLSREAVSLKEVPGFAPEDSLYVVWSGDALNSTIVH